MLHSLLKALPVAVALLLVSCQGMSDSDKGLPGSQIYTLSSSQDPGKPSTILYSVDIDIQGRDALKARLGSAYIQPEELYFWMAAPTKNGYYDVMGHETYRSILRIPLLADPSVLHYEGAFDLFDIMKADPQFGWLDEVTFDAKKGESNLTGYHLLASDAWWGAGPAGYLYELPAANAALRLVTFRDTVPIGQGLSNCVDVTGSDFVKILKVYGGYSYSLLTYTRLVEGDRLTVSYTSDTKEDSPALRLGIASSAAKVEIPGTWASAPSEISGGFQRVFTFRFSTGDQLSAAKGLDEIKVNIPAPGDSAAGTDFAISSTAGNYALSGLGYSYLGAPVELLPGGTVDFEGTANWTFGSGNGSGNSWAVGIPKVRDPAVELASLSSGKVLLIADPLTQVPGSVYARYRNDYVDLPVDAVIPANGNLLCRFSMYCDLAKGDWVRVSLVKSDGTELQWRLFDLDSHDGTLTNTWDPSILMHWKRLSTFWPGSAPAGVRIKALRFHFTSDSYLEGQGVSIDNVQLLGTR
ncbi:MAG: hypothetical protein WCQ50_15820 [Spirochaetota bacterium]